MNTLHGRCRYKWCGLSHLPATLAKIKVEDFEDRGNTGIGRSGDRREKSLGLLSQRFIQMFLAAPGEQVIALEGAAQMLLGSCLTAVSVAGLALNGCS